LKFTHVPASVGAVHAAPVIVGVAIVGLVSITNVLPVPVCEATAVALPVEVIGPVRFAFVVTVPDVSEAAVPLALVSVMLDGVPPAPLNRTGAPAEPTLTARAVATPVPRPVIPPTATALAVAARVAVAALPPIFNAVAVPVRFVATPDDGVPSAPLKVTNAPADPTFTPSAATTPVPVVVVAGAEPAPPPITNAFDASAPDDAHVAAPEKYGTPPLVPATVNASVPLVVTGEPATEIRPPVKVCPTLVTDPDPVPGTTHPEFQTIGRLSVVSK
jgi:hypothetical protein